MGAHDDPPRERREEPRHLACFPAHIQRPSGSMRMALIRDLSVNGALLLTRAEVEVGEALGLSLYLAEDVNEARVASGKVVRVVPLAHGRAEVWRHSVAVQFDAPLHDCEAEIRDLAAKQAALGLPTD